MSGGDDASSYDLGCAVPGLTLSRLPSEEAAELGAAFALLDPWSRYAITTDDLAAMFAGAEPSETRLVLRLDGTTAGVVILRNAWLRGPYLRFLGVLPAYQRHGLGTAVLEWLVGQARLDGAGNVFVCVSDFNSAGLALYAAHGFVAVGELPDLIRPGHTELLLRKRV